MSIENLKHTTRRLSNGGMVLILNVGSKISAEGTAMLQALHSRSLGGITHHLQQLIKRGAESFMATFYVGYAHKSIGDCGFATIFIEGVSMLAAKAIQDTRLYNGQEASTRYVDFSSQEFIDPIGSKISTTYLENMRSLYLDGFDATKKDLFKRYPMAKGLEKEDEKVYEKAINARAFDITRSLLPSGASTNLAWSGNLRQMADHIAMLRHHPLSEVREVAFAMEDALIEFFPSSFTKKRYEKTEEYNACAMQNYYYLDSKVEVDLLESHSGNTAMRWIDVDPYLMESYRRLFEMRPPKTELPKFVGECARAQFEFLLDFGSFRDIHRHRALIQRMPLLTMQYGFEKWYMDEFPAGIRRKVNVMLKRIQKDLRFLEDSEIAQYYIPMGFNTPNRITGNIHALTYLFELRATSTVHPTLASKAETMGRMLEKGLKKYGYVIHLEKNPTRFNIKRGEHDIIDLSKVA